MSRRFVKVKISIYCQWEGLAPIYRLYVDDELFSERNFIWQDQHLEEMLQIKAEPGRHKISLEKVGPNLAEFRLDDYEIVDGNAFYIGEDEIVIR